jgi:hypothetical protein
MAFTAADYFKQKEANKKIQAETRAKRAAEQAKSRQLAYDSGSDSYKAFADSRYSSSSGSSSNESVSTEYDYSTQIPMSKQITLISGKSGTGVEDPVAMMSYQTQLTPAELKKIEQTRYKDILNQQTKASNLLNREQEAQRLQREQLRPQGMSVEEFRVLEGTASAQDYKKYKEAETQKAKPTSLYALGIALPDQPSYQQQKVMQMTAKPTSLISSLGLITNQDKVSIKNYATSQLQQRRAVETGISSATLYDQFKTKTQDLSQYSLAPKDKPKKEPSYIKAGEPIFKSTLSDADIKIGKKGVAGFISSLSGSSMVREKGLFYTKKAEFELKEQQIFKGTYKSDMLDFILTPPKDYLFTDTKERQLRSLGIRKGAGLFVAKDPLLFVSLPAIGAGAGFVLTKLALTGTAGYVATKAIAYGGLGLYGATTAQKISKEKGTVAKYSIIGEEATKTGLVVPGAISGSFLAKPKITAVSITKIQAKRAVSERNVLDTLDIKGKVKVGNLWRKFEGTGEQLFTRLSDTAQFKVKVSGKVNLGALRQEFSARGFSLLGKEGARTLVATKSGIFAYSTTTKTQDNPLKFTTKILTGKVAKQGTVSNLKLMETGGAGTKEYTPIKDIFTGKEVVFRKILRLESGKPIQTDYLLNTKTATIGRKPLIRDMSDFFGKGKLPQSFDNALKSASPKTPPPPPKSTPPLKAIIDFDKTEGFYIDRVVPQKPLPKMEMGFSSGGKGLSLIKPQPTTTKTLLVSESALPQTTIIPFMAQKASQGALLSLQMPSTLAGVAAATAAVRMSRQSIKPKSESVLVTKPISLLMPQVKPTVLPQSSVKPLSSMSLTSSSKLLPQTMPISSPVTMPISSPVVMPISRPLPTSMPLSSLLLPPTIMPPAFPPLSGFLPIKARGLGDTSRKKGGKKKYRPSLRGIFLKIKQGSRPTAGLTGFEWRGI